MLWKETTWFILQVCGSRARRRSVYVSETNRLEVVIMSSKLDDDPVYFLLNYEGVTSPVHLNDSSVLFFSCIFQHKTWCGRKEQKLSYRQQIARKLRTQYAEGIYRHTYYIVTLKSKLRVTQGHWKRNRWIDHTRLSSSRVIWRWILLWPWNVG